MTWHAYKPTAVRGGLALAITAAVTLVAWTLHAAPDDKAAAPAAPNKDNKDKGTSSAPANTTGAASNSTDASSGTPAEALDPNVTILVTVVPPRAASVYWGRQRLGIIRPRGALAVKRPRDSGPLDLIIRADGFLPVHTRAYTFNDNRLSVKITPLDQISTLLGYREELPPPDAGVPIDDVTPETTLEPVP